MEPDYDSHGNLKRPDWVERKKENEDKIFLEKPAIKITREQISTVTPQTCELRIQASNKLTNFEIFESLYKQAIGKFEHYANISIRKISIKEYSIEIISGKLRCSWCKKFREFIEKEMNIMVINLGSCVECYYLSKNDKYFRA